jgi:hypothetical protein
MAFPGFDNMIITRKFTRSNQKINGICTPMTINADRLKIEIPINILIERYVQQACISNLLVTVFAALHIDSLLITETSLNLFNYAYGTPTRKELTAGPHAYKANTAP